jgi:hypothetical protein
MQDSNGASASVRYRVPDLRNSVHLKKMKKAGRLQNKNGLDLTNTNKFTVRCSVSRPFAVTSAAMGCAKNREFE